MKEFFFECLEKLDIIAGIKQMYYLNLQEDKDKQLEVLLKSLLYVSKKFNYIPEEYQKKYITQMMIEDQQYQALDSRTLWRWLDQHKSKHLTHSQFSETDLSQVAPPEVADKYLKQIQDNLEKIGNPQVAAIKEIIGKQPGLGTALTSREPRQEFVVGEECLNCAGFGKLRTEPHGIAIDCEFCEGTGKVNRCKVNAFSQEEADKAYEASK